MNENVRALRSEVAALERRVQVKMNRLARQNNAKVAGTEYDPRRPKSNVSRYTVKQLKSYRGQLQSFNSRKTQFYGDVHGDIVQAGAFERYKSAERRYNMSKDKFFAPYSKLKTANGMTIADRMQMVTPSHGSMVQSVNSPFADVRRNSRNFPNEGKMRRLAEKYEGKLVKHHWKDAIEEGRTQFRKMAEATGSDELIGMADNLNDRQFAGLWFYTGFAQYLSQMYAVYQMLLADRRGAWLTDIREKALSDAQAEIKNAKRWRFR